MKRTKDTGFSFRKRKKDEDGPEVSREASLAEAGPELSRIWRARESKCGGHSSMENRVKGISSFQASSDLACFLHLPP